MNDEVAPDPPPGFAWDEAKFIKNVKRHGIRFDDIVTVFADPRGTDFEEQFREGEQRWVWLGAIYGVVLYTVYVDRDEGATTRLISSRRATRRETDAYFQGS